MTEVLALIPARGGSKSIPRKNILPFAGFPLIAFSIAAGLASETVNRVIVSTDDEEIAGFSRRYGAETPFIRPAHLAEDSTPDLPVFQHALEWLQENEAYQPDIVVQLRPTSPLRQGVAHRSGGPPPAGTPRGGCGSDRMCSVPKSIQNVADRGGRADEAADPDRIPRAVQHAAPALTGRLLADGLRGRRLERHDPA